MPNNSQQEMPADNQSLTPEQIKKLAHELHEFRKSFLYQHYCNHFQTLFSETIDQILEERLKGPETLYTREGWLGEARAAKLNGQWFEMFHAELELALRALDD
jgi:hypothetical protein